MYLAIYTRSSIAMHSNIELQACNELQGKVADAGTRRVNRHIVLGVNEPNESEPSNKMVVIKQFAMDRTLLTTIRKER